MYCKKCNYQLKKEESVCPMCGQQVDLNEDANKKSELAQAIEQLKNGDEKGFSTLYTHTYKYVYSRAKMLSDSEQEVMDILQEVYISVYRNIGTLKSNDSLYAWLRTITFHAGGNMLKKNRKEILLSEEHEEMLESLADEDNAMEDECLNKQDIEAIRDCIKRLSNEHRAVIMAYYYDNLKVEEISELLSISAGTVKSRLHLARKKLKEYIQEQEKKQGYTFRSFGGVTLALALGSLLQQNMEVSESHNAVVFNNICNKLGLTSSSKFAGINSVVREGTQMLKEKILKTITGLGTKKLVALTIGVIGAVTITGTAVVVGITRNDNEAKQTEQTKSTTKTKEDEETKISDVTAPVVKLKDKVFTISDFAELTEEFLVETVSDDSQYEMSFVGYEKKAGLDVVNDEYIANLKESVGEELSVENLSAGIPTEQGVYRSVISFKDNYRNETLVEIYIIYDASGSVAKETATSDSTSTTDESSSNTSSAGRFVEKTYNFFPTTAKIFYDAPDTNANVIWTAKSYELIVLQAYNAQTGWYRTTLGINGQSYIAYCQGGDWLTTEEYRAILNAGVSEEYASLGCVKEPEHYTNNFISGFANYVTGKACIHIEGKHNFVSLELEEACMDRWGEAEEEWKNANLVYAVDNHDGTINVCSSTTYGHSTYTTEEFYAVEGWSDINMYSSDDDYTNQYEQYVLNEVYKVLNGQ